MKQKSKILLLENIHPDAGMIFKKSGHRPKAFKGGLSEQELAKFLKDVSVLGIRSKTRVTGEILKQARNLEAVGIFAIGADQIDLSTASDCGVAVFNAPYSNTRSVVELVLGEMIMLLRKTFDKSAKLHLGVWEKSAEGSFEARGKKLGIIGYGNIGSQLSVLAEALGMEVFYYDIAEKLALGNAKRCGSMEELLKKSNIVTLHVDGRKENKNLISEKEFKLMKAGAYLLNLSRGFVVDIPALVKYLKNGKIRGAAVDVFPKEPKNNNEKFKIQLQNLPNVILTPHVGGSTREAQKNIANYMATKLLNYLESGDTFLSLNFPNVQLPKVVDAHRFISIHKNVPGMLAKINSILAKHKINVEGQYLKTNEKIGYVITDVNKKYSKEVLKELANIPNTIKFRVLY